MIRPYRADDAAALRACFVALQDDEHDKISAAPTGEAIADSYLAWMHERVHDHHGVILVAETDGTVVGFVTVLLHVPRSDPDDSDPSHAMVSELSVMPGHRGTGIGSRLMSRAEALAREHGATNLRLAVAAANAGAHRLYKRLGFEDLVVLMMKRL